MRNCGCSQLVFTILLLDKVFYKKRKFSVKVHTKQQYKYSSWQITFDIHTKFQEHTQKRILVLFCFGWENKKKEVFARRRDQEVVLSSSSIGKMQVGRGTTTTNTNTKLTQNQLKECIKHVLMSIRYHHKKSPLLFFLGLFIFGHDNRLCFFLHVKHTNVVTSTKMHNGN